MKINMKQVRLGLGLSATMLLASSLFGCENQTHDENVAAAESRWKLVRSKVMLDTAQTQFDTGQLEMCERTLKEAVSFDPDNAELLTLFGRVAIEQGRLERAYHLFEAAIENDEALPDPYYYRGIVLQRWQQYQRAYDSYADAFERQGDNPSYLMAMSEMYVAMDRTDEAIAMLENRMIAFDQNAGIRSALGHLYTLQGDDDQAVEFFLQASQLDPENQQLQEDLGMAMLAAGHDEDAIDIFAELLKDEAYEDREDLWRLLAGAYERTGDITLARRVYFDLTRSDKAQVNDWIRLGELAWKQEDDGAALHAANRIVRLEPDRHEGYILAGLVWQKRERLDDALSMYDRAAEVAPDNASPLILRGIALQKAGRLSAAADAYTAALERQPTDPRAMRLLRSVADAMN